MKPTADIQPLVDIATVEFNRHLDAAHRAITDLDRFWTHLYGPNEALEGAHAALRAITNEWFGDDA